MGVRLFLKQFTGEISTLYENVAMNVAVFVYCGVALFVIVNGQSTTDDDIDKDEINRLVDLVAELKTEQAELRADLK